MTQSRMRIISNNYILCGIDKRGWSVWGRYSSDIGPHLLGPPRLHISRDTRPPGLKSLAKSLCTDILIRLLAHDYDAITRALVWWEGLGQWLGMGFQWLAGLASRVCVSCERRKIMIGSSGNSSGVVVGVLVCGTECSGFKSLFSYALIFFFACWNFSKFS